ncbi:MAG: HAMP domain-containing histidine kinase [Actinomycetia bacterium]|nr:HAMP domain-containing histidine kinase [Actinomycetes bacterium]
MTLKARVATGLGLVLVLLVALAIVVVARQRDQLLGQLDERLIAIAPLERPPMLEDGQPGAPLLAAPGGPDPLRRPISDVYIATVTDDSAIEVLVEGQLLDDVPDLSQFASSPAASRTFVIVDSVDGKTTFRVMADRAPDGNGTVAFAISTTDVDQTISRLIAAFTVVTTLVAVTLGAVAWWVIRLGLRPITDMTETAEAITSGERRQRAPELSDTTEAGRLAQAFNLMLDQRDEAEDRLRRFVSDASHELRTPLTSIRGYLEVYAAGGFREPGQLDDAVRRMRSESDRMGGLVDDLLRLARLDEEQPLELSLADVGELIRDVCADACNAQPDRDITADAPPTGELMATVDGQKLQQLVAGLIDNAVRYGPEAAVEVQAGSKDEVLTISVVDDGPGLSSEEAERVFDRFYRGDTSRSRISGGSGLGLSIAKSIVTRHRGTIDLVTASGQGCRFTIRLPVNAETPMS